MQTYSEDQLIDDLFCLAGYKFKTEVTKTNMKLPSDSPNLALPSTYTCSFDWSTRSYVFVESTVEKILGYKSELFYTEGLNFFLKLIHPADQGILKRLHFVMFEYFYRAPMEERPFLRFSYNIRVRSVTGYYVNILRQSTFSSVDHDGKPLLEEITNTDVTGLSEDTTPLLTVHKLAQNGMRELCYQQHFPVQPIRLSKREHEVLNLVKQGLTTREIAQCLFLSLETIKSHRKSILSKVGASNMSSAIHSMQNLPQ